MSESNRDSKRPEDTTPSPEPDKPASERAGRVLFLLAGGVLLSILVSCACGPVR